MSSAAPVFHDALALSGVLVEHLDDAAPRSALDERILKLGFDLLETITLALTESEPVFIHQADECLTRLRAMLALSHELDRFEPEPDSQLLELTESIARQIGGMLRSVGA